MPRALVGACLVKSLFALPDLDVGCGADRGASGLAGRARRRSERVGHATASRASSARTSPRLTPALTRVAAALRAQYPDFGRDVAIDASDLPAFANGSGTSARTARSASGSATRTPPGGTAPPSARATGGGFYGYKLHAAVCTRTGLPLAWRVETARRHESLFVAPLLDAAPRSRLQARDVSRWTRATTTPASTPSARSAACDPVIPLRGAKAKQPALPLALGGRLFPRIPRHTQRFRDLYRGRAAVEREFGRLKHDYGLAPLRVRGLERVQLHADLTMLGRLGLALSRARRSAARRIASPRVTAPDASRGTKTCAAAPYICKAPARGDRGMTRLNKSPIGLRRLNCGPPELADIAANLVALLASLTALVGDLRHTVSKGAYPALACRL